MFKFIFLIITTFFLCVAESNQENPSPILGDSLNKTITLADERRIGGNIYKNLQKNNYIINDVLVSDYISYLGNKLSRNISKDRKYVFFVTRSNSVNAFAVPGGYIGLNAGLITLTENEAQLAGVVAHELAHVVLRHSAEMIANSSVNSIPMWIGIFAGMLAGQTEASIASIKSGIGLSVQNNINLIRENEIEADAFAARLILKSNFDLGEMANFFRLMQGDSNNQSNLNEYFMTHPLYSNRISNIKNQGKYQNNPIVNSTEDYLFVKNILKTSNSNADQIINLDNENSIQSHQLALIEYYKGNFSNAKSVLEKSYHKDKFNIYIASLMSDILWSTGEKKEARDILHDILYVYPNNNAITFQLLKYNIKDSIKLDQSIKKLKEIMENNINNPVAYKLLAEGYDKIQEKYNSRLALINFYNIKGNMPMAFRVIDDGLNSKDLNEVQKKNLESIRAAILCDGNPPLQPIFGDKTCD
ncbi:MAG: M48 family metalloprotease [Pseudomonadota bacterium]|nr:M48 family metalloprotease [Pseudomonadota bacterium]